MSIWRSPNVIFAALHLKTKCVGILKPNPDKPEKIATKAPRHKAKRVTFWLIFIFASLCLGGVNVLPQNAKK